MTKEEHIKHWESQVDDDLDCAQILHAAGHHAQSLFWAHLALEKMCKALWVKNNGGNVPPLIHNLTRIVFQTRETFSEAEMQILYDMNLFQIKGRYPDFTDSLDKTITKETCEEYLGKSKTMVTCIRLKLQ